VHCVITHASTGYGALDIGGMSGNGSAVPISPTPTRLPMAGKISRLALCAAPGVVAMTPLRKTSPLRNAAAFCHAIPVLDITILASVVPGKCRDKMKWLASGTR
jgi:hypothetical protein